jgi:hypothetical protein
MADETIRIVPTFNWMLMKVSRTVKTEGGLFIPESAQDGAPGKTSIVKKGPDCGREDLQVGTEVVIDPRTAILDFSHMNLSELEDFFLVRESGIAAVVEREKE